MIITARLITSNKAITFGSVDTAKNHMAQTNHVFRINILMGGAKMIFFNIREVREYLVTHGIVYTIRNSRSEGITDAVQGNYRKWTKICKVNVKLMEENIISSEQLEKYAFQSGITLPITLCALKVDARQISNKWLDLAKRLSAQQGEQLNLYRVTVISEEPVAALLTTPF